MEQSRSMPELLETCSITVTVNGCQYERQVPVRLLLSDFLRHELHLTGTHVGCEHGVCGCCTILLDGEAVRSCLLLAVQVNGRTLTTIEGLEIPHANAATASCSSPIHRGSAQAFGKEGLAGPQEPLHPIQQAFREQHGLQCGFCTPGIILSVLAMLRDNPAPTEEEIRHELSGNLCRCTGYQNVVEAVKQAAKYLRTQNREGE